jgi:hypothetical protein
MNEKIGPTMADLRATSEAAGKEETIGVGPVSIPDSLDRSQIVTLSGGNEVIIAEFDRWYGSCRDEIARVMTENLSALLPSQRVVSYAWGRRVSLNRQITVDILRLDGVFRENGDSEGKLGDPGGKRDKKPTWSDDRTSPNLSTAATMPVLWRPRAGHWMRSAGRSLRRLSLRDRSSSLELVGGS